MAGYLHCCTLLQVWLVVLVTGLSMGTIHISRPACRADSIQLFDISQVDCVNTTWSLYKKNILIIVWDMHGSVPIATFVNGYKDKFFLDKSRNIWILDIQDLDDAVYSIQCPIGNTTKKYEVKLDVLVEPETGCKPKIIRGDDTLTTYLEHDSCGKPTASAYWLEQPGIFVDDNVIKLQPGQEAGTVYACVDSPSLRCAKNFKLSDYCSVFKDESKIHPKLSEISGVTIANLMITTLLFGFVILMAIVFYRQLTECNFCKTERIVKYIARTEPLDADLKLERVDERHKHSTDSIISFPRQTNSEQGEAIPLLEDIARTHSTPSHESDKEHEIEEATNEHPSSTNAENMKELQELRDAALCKICFGEKLSMVFMPCNHIATCVNCSCALQQCPVCRALIKEKMNISFS